MQIQVNTDDNLHGGASLGEWVEREVSNGLSRFDGYVTRIEAHLGDENAGKSGSADKRCMLEARASGQDPLSVTHQAPSVEEACKGAIRKLRGLLDSRLGKLQDHKGAPSIRDEPIAGQNDGEM
jgi:hypothetical protein